MDRHGEGRCLAIVEMSGEIDKRTQFAASEIDEGDFPSIDVVCDVYRVASVLVIDCSYVERFPGSDAHHHECHIVTASKISNRNTGGRKIDHDAGVEKQLIHWGSSDMTQVKLLFRGSPGNRPVTAFVRGSSN